MRVLELLTFATAASAAPVLANIKVVKVDSDGHQEIRELHAVELDDFKNFQELATHVTDLMHKEEAADLALPPVHNTVDSVRQYFDDFLARLHSAFSENFGTQTDDQDEVEDQSQKEHRKKLHHKGSRQHHKGRKGSKHHKLEDEETPESFEIKDAEHKEGEQIDESRLKPMRPHNVRPLAKKPHGKKASCHGKKGAHGKKSHDRMVEGSDVHEGQFSPYMGHVSQFAEDHDLNRPQCHMIVGVFGLVALGVLAKVWRRRAEAKRALRLRDEEDHQPPAYDEKALIEQEH